jgi:formylglycine-generating enzyme required for sulfatase activity
MISEVATAWINPVDGSEMICIAGGPFVVGPKKRPASCPDFSLARYPVTNARFARFLQATGYEPPAAHPDLELFLAHWQGRNVPQGLEDHPVVFVSLVDALHYVRWAGLTLPTEWLWEKAARGPEGRRFPWGEITPSIGQRPLANVRSAGTVPVDTYARMRTPYGCEDMIGNVSEWCLPMTSDDPGAMPMGLPDPKDLFDGGIQYAPVRGACFLRRVGWRLPSWHRRRLSVGRRNYWTGFRLAMLVSGGSK